MIEHYEFREIETKGGKKRRVGKPDDEAREFHDGLIKSARYTQAMRGSLKFRHSTAMNIRPHVENRSNRYYLLDLEDAYGSVALSALADVVMNGGVIAPDLTRSQTEKKLEEFCIDPETGGLIQGAPASQDLFDLYCESMDKRLGAFSAGAGFIYTRYRDDLTFSARTRHQSERTPIGKSKRRSIRGIIEGEGFRVSHPKSHVYSLHEKPITITGISIYPDFRVAMTPEQLQRANDALRRVIHPLENGKEPSPVDVERMKGYNSLIISLDHYFPGRKLKPAEATLREEYIRLQRALKDPLAAAAMIPTERYVQGDLFDQATE